MERDGVAVDEQTLQAAQGGDRNALGVLLRALQDSWFRMSLSLLGDPDLAHDATQETAIRFLRQLPGFRGDSQLRTWSLGICLNVVREMRRVAHAHRSIADGLEMAESADLAPPPADSLARAEAIQALRSTLAALPDRQREAVVLRFFEEMSVEQTAETMGCAPGTVKATVHQALRALRRKLERLV
ncbi:MAG TPA: RNA polymerase sigma factor [Tepidisphaeraceae bacterium]|jgi:RNA polymerase sigma-70 factor (ECF subfamily)